MPEALSLKHRFFQLYRSILNQNRGLILLLAAVTFLLFPVASGIEVYQQYRWITEPIEGPFRYDLLGAANIYGVFSSWYVIIYVLAAPMLALCFLCRPLHNKQAADLFHSLPLPRGGKLGALMAAGMTITAIPLLVGMISAPLVIRILCPAAVPGQFPPILWDCLLSLLVLFSMMSLVLFCGVCTGTFFNCVVFSLLIMFLPVTIKLLFQVIGAQFVNGLGSGIRIDMSDDHLLPLLTPLLGWFCHIKWEEFTGSTGMWDGVPHILFFFAAGCILFGISLWYIRRRKSEISGTLNQNVFLQSFVCILAMVAGGLAVGMFFTFFAPLLPDFLPGRESNQWLSLVLFSAIGGALVFVVVEMVLKRGLRSWKKQLIHGGIALAAMAAISGGALFYAEVIVEDYVPDAPQVQSISLQDDVGVYAGLSDVKAIRQVWDKNHYHSSRSIADLTFSSEESIQQILGLHKMIIEDANLVSVKGYEDNAGKYSDHSSYFNITYQLKNGRTIQRNYQFFRCDMAEAVLEKLCRSEEYIRQSVPLFNPEYTPEALQLSIWDGLTLRERPFPSPQQDVQWSQRLLDALSKEFIAMDPSVYLNETEQPAAWVSYQFSVQKAEYPDKLIDCSGRIPVYASFEQTVDVLKEYGYGYLLEPDLSTVERAVVSNAVPVYLSKPVDALGKQFVGLDAINFEEVRNRVNLIPKAEREEGNGEGEDYALEISQEELTELVPQMRLSTRCGERQKMAVLFTKDRYVFRYIEDDADQP